MLTSAPLSSLLFLDRTHLKPCSLRSRCLCTSLCLRDLSQFSACQSLLSPAPCQGMRIQEFVYVLLVKSGILGFGIWDTAPINDWNPESKIHKVESRIQDRLVFPPIGRLLAYFSVVIFLGKLLMPNDGNSQPD